MQDAAAPSHDEPAASSQHPPSAFSLQEAAALLGVSLNTLRRRIDAGQVRAERVTRPQGHVWRVYLDPPQPAEQRADSTLHQDAASTLPQPPTAIMQAEAMAAYTRSLLEPLVSHVAELEGAVRMLERENGRLAAENAALQAQNATLTASTAKQGPEPSTGPSAPPESPWWRRWLAAVSG